MFTMILLLGRLMQFTPPRSGRLLALALLGLLSLAASAQQTFNYTGAVQTYTVPAGASGVTIQANGAGGGSGGNDELNGWGGAGGAGAQVTATYLTTAGTTINIYVGQGGRQGHTSTGSYTGATAGGAGGLAGGNNGYAGGAGGRAGGSGYSGGGAGGGAASVLSIGNTRLLIAGGGGGGQGGARGVRGRAGLNSTSSSTTMTAGNGTDGAGRPNNVDGAGGGGGGGGCPAGAGGPVLPDTTNGNTGDVNTNTTAQAGAGGSCRTAAITNFNVTGGGGGTGGASVTSGGTSSGNPGGDGSVVITPIIPALSLTKSQPSPALRVGSNSAYTLTVTNNGTGVATTARVVDQLPANMSYVSGTGTGWTCSAAASGGGTLVTCNFVGTLSTGGGTSTLTITATPTSTTQVINRAAVDPVGLASPPTASTCTAANTPSAGCAAPVTNTPTSVILGLVKSAPSPALQVFSNSAYTLTVSNSGTAAATTARVVDQLPANLSYVSGTGTGWSCSTAASGGGTLVTCNYSGSIAASGGTATVVITVTSTSSAAVTNYAAVDPSGGTAPPLATTCTAANTPSAGCAAPVSNTAGRLVAGRVYGDTNHNGSLDGSESGTGVSTLFVKLVPRSGGVCNGPATAAAGLDPVTGAYSLSSVLPGDYCLVLNGNTTLSNITAAYPTGWLGTQNPSGQILLTVGAAPPPPQNFGVYNGSKLSGQVFLDNGAGGGLANNGLQGGSEAGLAGVTVRALRGGLAVDSTSTAGDGSYTLWLPATPSGLVTVTPTPPAGHLATGGAAGSTGGSYSRPSVTYTAAAGQSYSGVNFGLVPANTLGPNGAQTAPPGSAVLYPHTYSAGTGGQVSFTLTHLATPALPGWTQLLYRDSNCNATLEASEQPLSAALTVSAGQTVCLIVKQFVPAGAAIGVLNSVSVSAAFSYTNASPALALNTLLVTDVTTVSATGDLTLSKLVANLTQAIAAATEVRANPGDLLQYTLTATNHGSQTLTTLSVNDATPAFTTYVSSACPASLPTGITACSVTTQPAVGAEGALAWTLTGALPSSAQLSVTYVVQLGF